jgi:hypothetical protein
MKKKNKKMSRSCKHCTLRLALGLPACYIIYVKEENYF